MIKTYQKQIFEYFYKKNIRDFIGVPDSTLKQFIDNAIKKKKIIITTKEEEAIGIAVGISLSGSVPIVFMQNAGFANSMSTITSLIQLYQIPVIFLIGWRGFLRDDAPEHEKIGKIQPNLLKILELENRVLSDQAWKKDCDWALAKIRKKIPCALIVKREFLD